jgi:DNA polymerase III gamma/tau subunit
MNNKEIEAKLYALVECLADNYGFDADKAYEYIRWETETDHVLPFLKPEEAPKKETKKKAKKSEPVPEPAPAPAAEPAEEEENKNDSPLQKARKNVALWTKKLDANKFKDEAAKQKHVEKLEKEKKKLQTLEEAEPKSEPVKAEEPKKEKKVSDKRISRMTPTLTGQLKLALEEFKLEMTDKLKKEFVKYIDDLTDDDFRRTGLADHMREFAKLKAPVSETVELPVEPTVEQVDFPTLRRIKKVLKEDLSKPGVYFNTETSTFVTGPLEQDEDVSDPVVLNGKEYVIGDKTGRVYEVGKDKDIFAGFTGIGQFYELDL